jgi:phosphotransferase system  glucose/maltose/N-acetylglucosamine-specific IIC component
MYFNFIPAQNTKLYIQFYTLILILKSIYIALGTVAKKKNNKTKKKTKKKKKKKKKKKNTPPGGGGAPDAVFF